MAVIYPPLLKERTSPVMNLVYGVNCMTIAKTLKHAPTTRIKAQFVKFLNRKNEDGNQQRSSNEQSTQQGYSENQAHDEYGGMDEVPF